jgi:hypothetical protein
MVFGPTPRIIPVSANQPIVLDLPFGAKLTDFRPDDLIEYCAHIRASAQVLSVGAEVLIAKAIYLGV